MKKNYKKEADSQLLDIGAYNDIIIGRRDPR